MATMKEDEYLQSMSDKDLRNKFRETLRDVDKYTLRLEQSSNLLGSLETELIKRAVGELAKQIN
jgi:hypothetical protein